KGFARGQGAARLVDLVLRPLEEKERLSLRAERSNLCRGYCGRDCFVAPLLAMTLWLNLMALGRKNTSEGAPPLTSRWLSACILAGKRRIITAQAGPWSVRPAAHKKEDCHDPTKYVSRRPVCAGFRPLDALLPRPPRVSDIAGGDRRGEERLPAGDLRAGEPQDPLRHPALRQGEQRALRHE